MQLRSLILYSKSGKTRELKFRLGELNIITGSSRTGKSIILDIVDFCLGRDDAPVSVGPITRTVEWVAVLLELPDTRAFVARRLPAKGRKSISTAMLEFGSALQALPYERLDNNCDSDELRQQLGLRIGLGDVRSEPQPGSLQAPFAVHLGHAVPLCLQNQDEITTRSILFHRQGERDAGARLTSTLPYFLGAVGDDQAQKQHELTTARRILRRRQQELKVAETADGNIDARLHLLLAQARTAGLISAGEEFGSREALLDALREAVRLPSPLTEANPSQAERTVALQDRRSQLRHQLEDISEQRRFLTRQEAEESSYSQVVQRGISRLYAVDLLPPSSGPLVDDATCPLCASRLPQPDSAVEDMLHTLSDLRGQLASVHTVRPRREQALRELAEQADTVREELRGVEGALNSLAELEADRTRFRAQAEEQAFLRGRIDAHLSQLPGTGDTYEGSLLQMRASAAFAQATVDELEAELDTDAMQDRLDHALSYINTDMTAYAQELKLEHSERNVRLDVRKLTVLADTDDGITPLLRIGSGENWVGYHLVAHLALHRFFALNHRPVPRMLLLDQVTQPFYPSEVAKDSGNPELIRSDADRNTVHGMFELMYRFTHDLAPDFQLIVSDHANLPDQWYQDCVRYNWRDGEALVPQSWIDEHPSS
ncbi:DUF3732 domain-containing protein [Streptomyces cyaneofuscatus]|uniref:DUF3732 domain-containing protein n=1 Tax=Streptomyces cyaneofuscatus TaxID=66883 RepID=UPI0013D917A5|nr:DUF3732 domain-containing protein [Streptomyces cyaneofuscatus]